MNVIDAISAFLALLIGLAALSLIVKPGGKAPDTLMAFGDSVAKLIKAAKGE